ncbi:hypothetical protein SEA_GALADRIEL_83 [Gordonia phage Galadriel]|uniref:Uncharacterized protein n=1 Tax=Gordonia phage Galadriel TaxID=2591208 RepID=A0A514DER8_9CAUD|nr:hypothetical protein KNU61_gp83 [Gordonia phage Galadriel]QDH92102.1 hypothetical protein SEA_GALADRIEL_83 [Gordonia phage Galadriel]
MTATPLWWRLLNPIRTLRPPTAGSKPEPVLSPFVPHSTPIYVNDDWEQTAKRRIIAVSDGLRRQIIDLAPGPPGDDDWLVFLGNPTRLWVRTFAPPTVGSWLPHPPQIEVGEIEDRAGIPIRKAHRG